MGATSKPEDFKDIYRFCDPHDPEVCAAPANALREALFRVKNGHLFVVITMYKVPTE